MPPRITIADDRVLRPTGWWTPTVHALLEHLHAVGFDRAPRPLGVERGLEVLSMIPGDSGAAGWSRVVPDEGLRAFARLLRDYHEAGLRGARCHPGGVARAEPSAIGGRGPGSSRTCGRAFGPAPRARWSPRSGSGRMPG